MSLVGARRRNGTPSVKHGCAFEERKMLNCVGKFRGKQQTWLDWLIILLSWDMITKKLVSSITRSDHEIQMSSYAEVYPGRQRVVLMPDSFALA